MSSNVLFLEGASGISGDMTVAALLGLGASREKLASVLQSLHLEGFTYNITEKSVSGIAGLDFDVNLESEHHHEEHHHDHEGDAHGHHHHHEHRNLQDVYAVIDRGMMSDRARALAKKIFLIVAEAESKAHGLPVEQVHFHEVGAIDSIVDIVSAAVCVDDLGIMECVVTGLSEGHGFVHCAHGDLPVPVPAVMNIAAAYGILLRNVPEENELVTPTGIAIAAALRTSETLPLKYRIKKVGIGLGKRSTQRPNMLRALLIESEDAERSDDAMFVLETNVDDCTGEALGLAMEKLFAAGARDVQFSPCFMKKNRPGYLLRAIVTGENLEAVRCAIFRNTTTIGIREMPVNRTCMGREIIAVKLPYGEVKVKKCTYRDIVKFYPEFESVKCVADACGKDFGVVFSEAMIAAGANG